MVPDVWWFNFTTKQKQYAINKKNTLHFDLLQTQQEGYNTVKLLSVVCEALAGPRVPQLQKSMMDTSILLLFILSIIGNDLYDTLNSLLWKGLFTIGYCVLRTFKAH